MRVRTLMALLLLAAASTILALTACGGDEATAVGTGAEKPGGASSAATLPPALIQTPMARSKPTPTLAPTAIPSIIPTIPTITPTVFAEPNPSSLATATPTVRPTTALSPEPATTPEPTPVPQSASLQLDVTFPPEDLVVDTETILVTGIASPDATVSVNGNLAVPGAAGRFTFELTISPDENPLAIEVIATSVAGEELSVVRTVIFVP